MCSDVAGSNQDLLPALLLIHGDSYSWGAGNSFDGTALAAHGRLIVVSINFRLGVLGKLAILTRNCLIPLTSRCAERYSQSFAVTLCDCFRNRLRKNRSRKSKARFFKRKLADWLVFREKKSILLHQSIELKIKQKLKVDLRYSHIDNIVTQKTFTEKMIWNWRSVRLRIERQVI